MIEFYKEVARYQADIHHERSGDMIDFRAIVLEGPREGMFYIKYSHTYRPTDGAGFYYSNSFTAADSAEAAEVLVKSWASQISKGAEYKTWSDI